jgi:hypothetical protein
LRGCVPLWRTASKMRIPRRIESKQRAGLWENEIQGAEMPICAFFIAMCENNICENDNFLLAKARNL